MHVKTDRNNSVNRRSCRVLKLLLTIYIFFCFRIVYFCFMVVEKTSVNPCQDRKKKADILWLSSVIPVEEVLLFFLLPYLIYWFIALGIYPFLGEALLNCIIENLRTLLMKISFENKCLGTWISNANAFFYHHKM